MYIAYKNDTTLKNILQSSTMTRTYILYAICRSCNSIHRLQPPLPNYTDQEAIRLRLTHRNA